MSVTDDDVIRRRLLIDGDGGMDDKRINNLLRTFIKWCNTQESEEDSYATSQRLMSTLAQCEASMEKSVLVYEMNLKEQRTYEDLNQRIEDKIKDAMDKISKCKNELKQAKTIRRNRQEYDNLAAVIQENPDRQTSLNGSPADRTSTPIAGTQTDIPPSSCILTEIWVDAAACQMFEYLGVLPYSSPRNPDRHTPLKKLQELEDGLKELTTTKEKLEQKLELRRKQFHVLLSSIHELKRILEDDENTEETEMET